MQANYPRWGCVGFCFWLQLSSLPWEGEITKIASVAEVKAHFSAFLKASETGPVIVTRNGKPAAVLLSVEDEDEIERLILAYSQVPEDIKYSEATDSGDRWYSTRRFLARSRNGKCQ